jgi:hypothetical protein
VAAGCWGRVPTSLTPLDYSSLLAHLSKNTFLVTGGGAVAALGALEHLAGDAEAASVMRIGGGVICLGGLLSEDAPPVARSRAASALAALIDSPSMCDEVESCSGAIRRVVAMLELDRAVGEQVRGGTHRCALCNWREHRSYIGRNRQFGRISVSLE